jgi:hypothetical protein
MHYQLLKGGIEDKVYGAQRFDADSATSFVFDPANTDYQQFKIQVADGTPLEDPSGNVMTQDEVNAFLETLP